MTTSDTKDKVPHRVAVYIDGFNLYFGLRARGWKSFYWLDLISLSNGLASLLFPSGHVLVKCHYFTARIKASPGSQSKRRQDVWLRAVQSLPGVKCHYGRYLKKKVSCRQCNLERDTFEEKMTDVRIATQLLEDAFDDVFDTAIIISGDSDLLPPIESIKGRFPHKKVVVAFPPARHSDKLRQIADQVIRLKCKHFRNHLLPDTIELPNGRRVYRPGEWKHTY